MRNYITTLIAIFMALLSINAFSAGVSSVAPDFRIGIGLYGQNVDNSSNKNNDNLAGVFASAFYKRPDTLDLGIELAALDWGNGIFVSTQADISSKFTMIAGVGSMGYEVVNELGDYYAQEPALMFGASYSMGKEGDIVARFILTESSKSQSRTTNGQTCEDDSGHHHHRPVCETSTSTESERTDNRIQAIMIGYQYRFN